MLVRARVESIDRDSNFPPLSLSLSLSLFLFFWSILVRIPAEISYRGAEIKWRETFYDESRELEISVMRNETFFREDFLFFFSFALHLAIFITTISTRECNYSNFFF